MGIWRDVLSALWRPASRIRRNIPTALPLRPTLFTRLILAFTVVPLITATPSLPRANGCPNESIRSGEVSALTLPDCRAYEQVSPVPKNLTDAAGEPGIVQASPSGPGIAFFAVAPLPGSPGSAAQAPTYLSVASPDRHGWLTQGLLPAAAPGSEEQIIGLTEDLANTILFAEQPTLAPGAQPAARNAYVEDNATASYQLLAANIGVEKLAFADATPGASRILFETTADLSTTNVAPAPGVTNLYEWNEAKPLGQRVTLAGVLPDNKAPLGGSVAGPGGPATAPRQPGGSTSEFYTQATISENGARVFFTDLETGIIYIREPEAERTVQVSAGTTPAYWLAATPTGSFVFYTQAEDLYRYNSAAQQREPITSGPASVQGTLGTSDDGRYLYFVATAKLASNRNGNGEEAEAGADNLYEWHEEPASHAVATTFIARLLGPNPESHQDEPDWRDYDRGPAESSGPSGGEKRLTPNSRRQRTPVQLSLTAHRL